MKYTNADILNKLREYSALERKKRQLEFELAHYKGKVTGDDIIESMTFGSGITGHVDSQHTTDKTSDIAESYTNKTSRLNSSAQKDMVNELRNIELEMHRIVYYTSLLNDDVSEPVQLHYFRGFTLAETATNMRISESTVKRAIRAGVKMLTEMYNAVGYL